MTQSFAISRRSPMQAAFFLIAVACLCSSSAVAEEPAQILELEEALEQARTNGPLRAELEAGEDFARARQSRADRARWPTLRTESLLAPVPANADPTRIDENIDEITSFNLGPYFRHTARVVVPLYTFGRISTAQELAELGVSDAEWESRDAMQEHLTRTRQAYYGRQLARAFSDVLDEGGEIVKDTLHEMEEDRAFGEADFSTDDLRRLQVFDAELDTMLLDNQRLSDLTEAALNFLIDGDGGALEVPPLDPEEASDATLGDLATYQEMARTHRPELRRLEHGVRARELEERLARREFFPNFFFAANLGFGWSTEEPALQRVCRRPEPDGPCIDDDTLFTHPYSNPFDTFTIGVAVGMQWNFDFGQRRGRLQEARANTAQIEAQRERALGGLELEIEEAWREAYDARQRMEIEERRFNIARRWRNQYGLQAEFARADQDMRDLIDPLSEFYDARVGYLESAYQYLVARAELARKVGVESLSEAGANGITANSP